MSNQSHGRAGVRPDPVPAPASEDNVQLAGVGIRGWRGFPQKLGVCNHPPFLQCFSCHPPSISPPSLPIFEGGDLEKAEKTRAAFRANVFVENTQSVVRPRVRFPSRFPRPTTSRGVT